MSKNIEQNVEEKDLQATENIEQNENIDVKHTEIATKTAKAVKGKMVEIKIPIDQQNKKDLIVPVIINGYRWEIKRGEKVVVPAQVAKILEEANYI